MGPIPVLTATVLVSAVAFGKLMHTIAERDAKDRAAHAAAMLAPEPRSDAARADRHGREARPARLEKRQSAREMREARRCRRLMAREWGRMRERRRGRPATARDAADVVARLPDRCRRVASWR